jgi:hypothetical protein
VIFGGGFRISVRPCNGFVPPDGLSNTALDCDSPVGVITVIVSSYV